MNRPKQLNALSGELMDALVAALAGARRGRGDPVRSSSAAASAPSRRAPTSRSSPQTSPVELSSRTAARALGRDPRRAHADRRRGLRLLPRRRLRAGDALRPDRRLGDGAVRPARDRRRDHPRRGRHAAADARRRQGGRDGHDPHRADALGARGARLRARRPRRRAGGVARRGEAGRARDRREGARSRRCSRRRRSTAPSRGRSRSASSSSGARSPSRSPRRTRRRG